MFICSAGDKIVSQWLTCGIIVEVISVFASLAYVTLMTTHIAIDIPRRSFRWNESMKMRLLSKQLGNFASKYFNFIGVLALFTLYKAVNIRTNHSDQQKSPRKDVSSSNLLLKDEHLSAVNWFSCGY